ncbi:MAG: cadmium-translocating P-type ATPase [Ahniella sp.]|nr:cadmium-translocating P-type ATPase [Ahniella sp.]
MTVVDTQLLEPTAAAAVACFHCGELTRSPPGSDGRYFCCTGCEAASTYIQQSGLGDYYRLRTERGSRPSPSDLAVFDRSEVLARYSRESGEGQSIELAIEGMHCAACAWLIGEALRRQPGVRDASANFVTSRARIAWSQGEVKLSDLLGRIEGLGYRASLAGTREQQEQRRQARRTLILRLGIAGLASMQAMMFSEALYLDVAGEMSIATRDFFRWLSFLASTPVMTYSAWPFWQGALNEWRLRRFGMDTLSALAIGLAFGASLVETLRGGVHVWFDAAVMFVFFLLLARSLEGFLRGKAQAHLERLASARPALAVKVSGTQLQTIPAEQIAVGDVLMIAAGSAVPADGTLDSPRAHFDESLLSGESEPQDRQFGDRVLAGSICLDAQARVRVVAVGASTRLSEIERAISQAAASRPAVALWLDRLVQHFVLVILVLAALTTLVWLQIDASRALPLALAVLMVSCPCALALAIPTALLAAESRLGKSGLLCLDTDALLALQEIDTVVLDKTGTVTEGQPRVDAIACLGDRDADACLAIARALEQGVTHPVAEAFRGDSPWSAEDVKVVAGSGVSGLIHGRLWRLGSPAWIGDTQAPAGTIVLADDSGPMARFHLVDALRADAIEFVQALKAQGLNVVLLSGDQPATVSAVAQQLGIESYRASQSPEDKLADLRLRRSQGSRLAMLGDGINDAPILAAADVGFTFAKAAPLAQHASDLVALNGRLTGFLDALDLSRRLHRIIRQNLFWALAYNVLMLPLAAIGWIGPGLAALGMSLSSLLVTLNALRLQRR